MSVFRVVSSLRLTRRSHPAACSETYQYYDLPFCPPEGGAERKREDLGEARCVRLQEARCCPAHARPLPLSLQVLEGDRLMSTPYELPFRQDKGHTALCTKVLAESDLRKFRTAVSDDYYFQFFYDDLPLWGFIGKVEKVLGGGSSKLQLRYFLFTHVHFDVAFNGDSVIEINVSTDPLRTVDITAGAPGAGEAVTFSYSVAWKPTGVPFSKRMEKYSRYSFLPQHLEIHWFSIINSCVTVLLLTGFLATILLRVLKNDFVRFNRDDAGFLDGGGGGAGDEGEETGWKYIHADVFRFPPFPSLFAAVIGTGTQLLVLTFCVFALALLGTFYPYSRGNLLAALVVLFCLTAGVAGYVSADLYRQLGGDRWVRNVLLTAALFCGPALVLFAFLNSVAIAYRSTAALPFGTIVIIILMWSLLTFPLTVLGGIAGRNRGGEFYSPVRTSKYPREVPPLQWYRATLPQMAMAGFLPFSAIYIELYYVFASVWGHKVYTIYSILFIVFLILLVVTAFITISLTYFQLAVEDHRWWWRAVLCGGSTGFFIFGYSLYYFHLRSDMRGFMQTSFFFGYMGLICYGFALMLGAVGWRASLMFVRHIYRSIKCE